MTAEQEDKGAEPLPPSDRDTYHPGHTVEGLVTSVSDHEVELTLDDGRKAVIPSRDFSLDNTDPRSLLSVGDKAFGAELMREDPKSRVVLSRVWALKTKAWAAAEQAKESGELVNARVSSAGTKGAVVDLKGLRGFVPSSHLRLDESGDLESFVGEVLQLRVIEVDPKRERLVLSRRSLLLKERRKELADMLADLKPGDVRTGKVVSITNYGAFVDIGGLTGLVHLSELSWKRVRNAAEVVSVGDEVEAKVIGVDTRRRRVGLSIRQLTKDPLAQFEVGAVLTGMVTRVADFGAFVRLGEIEGLVHVSEMAEHRVSAPEDVVVPGEEVYVEVMSIDDKRRRIELSMRRAAEFSG